jgi:hypothetical protein
MHEYNERYLPGTDNERRSLRRVAPTAKVWAAVENTSRNEMLGMAEVSDFSGLGIALRNVAGDPVAAIGDKFCVTLVAEEGIIPLSGTLVHLDRSGKLGLRLDSPEPPGQQFLIRVYQRASATVHAD